MEICWITLQVSDLERSLAFYTEVLELPISTRHEGEGTQVVMLGADEKPKIELLYDGEAHITNGAEGVFVGLEVASLDEAMADMKRKGVAVDGPISPAPHVRFAFVKDPDGVRIQLVERLTHD